MNWASILNGCEMFGRTYAMIRALWPMRRVHWLALAAFVLGAQTFDAYRCQRHFPGKTFAQCAARVTR